MAAASGAVSEHMPSDPAEAGGFPGVAKRLRAVGLRATRPRRLVLALLEELGGHRSVDELAARLQDQGTPLPRPSIYNIVEALVAAGLPP